MSFRDMVTFEDLASGGEEEKTENIEEDVPDSAEEVGLAPGSAPEGDLGRSLQLLMQNLTPDHTKMEAGIPIKDTEGPINPQIEAKKSPKEST